MELNKEEKQVLSILDGIKIDDIEKYVQKFVKLPNDKIQKIIQKLEKLNLITKVLLPNDNKLHYFLNSLKINPDMLDDDLRFQKDYGTDSHLKNT